MKKIILTLMAMLTIVANAEAMSYEQARNEALFLTDKMAYELNLTDAQYEAAYEINLDYLMSVTNYDNVFGAYWERRNADLNYILYSWQWDLFRAATYFYRPLYWNAGYWHFRIYIRYPHRDYFYFGRPHFYASYRGGHSWRMNGGRSYYAHHHNYYRPNIHRAHHSGMRDNWNHGSYRSAGPNNSSTRVTGRESNARTLPNNSVTHSSNPSNPSNPSNNAVNHSTGSSRSSMSHSSSSSRSSMNYNPSSSRSSMSRSSGSSRSSMNYNPSSSRSSMSRSSGSSRSSMNYNPGSSRSSMSHSSGSSRSSMSHSSGATRSSGATSSRGGGGGRSGGRR